METVEAVEVVFTFPTNCRYWEDLSTEERSKVVKDRLKKYTQKVRAAVKCSVDALIAVQ